MWGPDHATQLRDAISNWERQLGGIKAPDTVFQENVASIEERSITILKEFRANSSDENAPSALKVLLAAGGQIRDMEIEHADTINEKRSNYSQDMAQLADKILKDCITIFSFATLKQRLLALSPLGTDRGGNHDSPERDDHHLPELQEPAADEPCRSPSGYHTRLSSQERMSNSGPLNKRKRDTFEKRAGMQDRGRPMSKRRRRPISYTARPSWGSYHHNTRQKTAMRKSGPSIRNKVTRLGEKCHTLSVVIYGNPTLRKWECAAYVPYDVNIPDLNVILDDFLRDQGIQYQETPQTAPVSLIISEEDRDTDEQTVEEEEEEEEEEGGIDGDEEGGEEKEGEGEEEQGEEEEEIVVHTGPADLDKPESRSSRGQTAPVGSCGSNAIPDGALLSESPQHEHPNGRVSCRVNGLPSLYNSQSARNGQVDRDSCHANTSAMASADQTIRATASGPGMGPPKAQQLSSSQLTPSSLAQQGPIGPRTPIKREALG